MKGRLILAVAAIVLAAGTAQANFFDAFNYPNGGLVANSGGVWRLWGGFPGNDARVINGAVNITDFALGVGPDVDTLRPGNILAGTTHALFAFDFLINGSGDDTPQVNLGPDDWNYGNALILFFNVAGPGSLNAATNVGNVQIGSVTLGQWHHLDASINTAGGNAYYDFSIDNVRSAVTNWGALDPIRGLDAIEMGVLGEDNNLGTYVLVDNVFAGVPEPATLSLLALGGLGLLRRRARARRRV